MLPDLNVVAIIIVGFLGDDNGADGSVMLLDVVDHHHVPVEDVPRLDMGSPALHAEIPILFPGSDEEDLLAGIPDDVDMGTAYVIPPSLGFFDRVGQEYRPRAERGSWRDPAGMKSDCACRGLGLGLMDFL